MTKDELRKNLDRQARAVLELILEGETVDPGMLQVFTTTMHAVNALESLGKGGILEGSKTDISNVSP